VVYGVLRSYPCHLPHWASRNIATIPWEIAEKYCPLHEFHFPAGELICDKVPDDWLEGEEMAETRLVV
jgi:hypothetical protein